MQKPPKQTTEKVEPEQPASPSPHSGGRRLEQHTSASRRDGDSYTTFSVLDSAARFTNWWNRRAEPDDRAIVAEAERRGLISRAHGLLFLTAAGKELAKKPTDIPDTGPGFPSHPENENLSAAYIAAGKPGWPTTRNVITTECSNTED